MYYHLQLTINPPKSIDGTDGTDGDDGRLRRSALDELARVFHDPGAAMLIADEAGLPASRTPVFTTPMEFWHKIARLASNGVLFGGILPIIEAASRAHPYNPAFAEYCRSRTGRRSSTSNGGNISIDQEVVLDLTEQAVIDQIAQPWSKGEKLLVNGRFIHPRETDRLQITSTPSSAQDYIQQLEIEQRRGSRNEALELPELRILAVERGEDVTRRFLSATAGNAPRAAPRVLVLIACSRDDELTRNAEAFLRGANLRFIVRSREQRGQPSPDDSSTADLGYGIVLLTPSAGVRPIDDADARLPPRASPEAMLELGLLLGKLGRDRICCIKSGLLEIPSRLHDLLDINTIDSSLELEHLLSRVLRSAGYAV